MLIECLTAPLGNSVLKVLVFFLLGRYASIAFLWTIRDRGDRQGVTSNIHPNRSKQFSFLSFQTILNFGASVTFAQRMRILSRIALSNFIIPSLFSIAQLIVVYRNVNVLIVNDIILVNSMLAVFGVVFATVWAGSASRREVQLEQWENTSPTDDDLAKPRRFAFPGLGTWHVASTPPTLTFGSTVHTVPTNSSGLIERGEAVSEKGNDGGVSSFALRWFQPTVHLT